MTTGRINQVATLSKSIVAHAYQHFSSKQNNSQPQHLASRWECLGKCSSSQIPQQAVVHWLTSFPRIRFEPSIALNQRHENNSAQPQRGTRMFSVGQTAALAKHKRLNPKGTNAFVLATCKYTIRHRLFEQASSFVATHPKTRATPQYAVGL